MGTVVHAANLGVFPQELWGEKIGPHLGVRDLQALACASHSLAKIAEKHIERALVREFSHIQQVKQIYLHDLSWKELAARLAREGALETKVGCEGVRFGFCRVFCGRGDGGGVMMMSSFVPFTLAFFFGLILLAGRHCERSGHCAPSPNSPIPLMFRATAGTGAVFVGLGLPFVLLDDRCPDDVVAGKSDYSQDSLADVYARPIARWGREGRLGSDRQVKFAILGKVVVAEKGTAALPHLEDLYRDCK